MRLTPFVKWVGGKRQLLEKLKIHLPKLDNHIYCEAFIGGGALFFELQPDNAIINDANQELINAYKVIKNNLNELLIALQQHENNASYFYQIRALDRNAKFIKSSDLERASRFLYLNKTCFNGLFRVNNALEFNTPFGRYKNPNIVNAKHLQAVSEYLNTANIIFHNNDFEETLKTLSGDVFVYLDPPYDPISLSANFTSYTSKGFNKEDQERLKNACDSLNHRGIKFLLSNSATKFIRDLYKHYDISLIQAKRLINATAHKRGFVNELLIKNY